MEEKPAEEKLRVIDGGDPATTAKVSILMDALEEEHGWKVMLGVLVLQTAKMSMIHGLSVDSFRDEVDILMKSAKEGLARKAGEDEDEGPCAFCGKPQEGNHSIHRDGCGDGPEVPLCNACGSNESPSCTEIWAKIRSEG